MAYQVSNYKTWVRARLQNITIDDTVLLQFANDANREVAGLKIPGMVWQFMQSNFAGTLTTGSLSYDFETNWDKPTDMTIITPDGSSAYPIYISYAQYRQSYPDPTAGTTAVPAVWTTRARTFMVGPTAPDQGYTLDMAYNALPATLTAEGDTIDIPDAWAEVQVLGMLKRCLQLRRRYDQAQVIAQDLDPNVDDSLMSRMISSLMVEDGSLPTRANTGWYSGISDQWY